MEDYVKNFSEAADIINVTGTDGESPNKMMGFAQAIRLRMQTAVAMDKAGHAIVHMMKGIRRKRELREQGIAEEEDRPATQMIGQAEEEFNIEQQHTVFNKSLEEESKTINNIAQDLLRKVKYQKIFKSNDLESANVPFNRGVVANLDPRIKYF